MSNEDIHTPELLQIADDGSVGSIQTVTGTAIGHTFQVSAEDLRNGWPIRRANAARLVLCWNACFGISTKDLADGLNIGRIRTIFARHAAEAERDELQARLEQGKAVWKQDQGRMAEIVARRDEAIRVLDGLLEYFRSGNDVAVPQATIRADSPEVKAAFELVGKATNGRS